MAKELSGISLVMHEHIPIVQCFPILNPLDIVADEPIKHISPILTSPQTQTFAPK
jgi:hypothetical protein